MLLKQKSIVFDLDDTIAFPDHTKTDTYEKYARAVPNYELIKIMQRLHSEGFFIHIYTARRMLTHNGDVEAIKKDVGNITFEWLFEHKVPYDVLTFGKPYSSTYYVDDKAMTANEFVELMNKESIQ
jgi:capsule biosynthesis phosphatase